MRLAEDIPVARGDQKSRAAALFTARDVLRKRCSVMFFPEGTRSRDGRLLPFNDGAFRLAVKAQVPLLPLAVDGTTDALPKGGWRFGPPSDIRLAILAPIDTAGLTAKDVPALRERVRLLIAEQIAAWRGVPVADVLVPEPPPEALPPASETLPVSELSAGPEAAPVRAPDTPGASEAPAQATP